MHIDMPDSLRALRDLSHDEPTQRPAQTPPGLANVVAEHLALHGAGDRLRASLVQWGDEQGSTGGQSRFGWRNPRTD